MTTPPYVAWACFRCRKSFKKDVAPSYRTGLPVITCPGCQGNLEFVGRCFAPPRRADAKAWKEARNWLVRRRLPSVATMTYQEILQNETASSQKKAQAKKARQIARAAWRKKKYRKRHLRDVERSCQQPIR